MKAFIYSAHAYEIPLLDSAARNKHELVLSGKKLSLDTVQLSEGCYAVAIFTGDNAEAEILRRLRLQGVRYLALRSAGHDHVDMRAAALYGIKVANVPAYSPYAIAEHAVALLLSLNRRIIEGQRLIRLQDFRLDTLTGFDIHGKTVGIIGTGTIGMTFAKIMNGFGVTLIAYDVAPNEEAVKIGVTYVSIDELFSRSDIISIHCPLTDATRYLIGAPQLGKMKKNCIIINTSRGGIVHTAALLDALDNEQISGACLDVYENEKKLFFEDHQSDPVSDPLFARLVSNNKIMLTGHQAFLTNEALKGIADTTILNLDCWQNKQQSPNQL